MSGSTAPAAYRDSPDLVNTMKNHNTTHLTEKSTVSSAARTVQENDGMLHSDSVHVRPQANPARYFNLLLCWVPEIIASILSVGAFVTLIAVLCVFRGRAATDLHLPKSLTLNGIIAAVTTVNKACMMVPVGSGLMQEMWLFFASQAESATTESRLRDIDEFAGASSGVVGSLIFLVRSRGKRLVPSLGCLIILLALAYDTFTQQLVTLRTLPDFKPNQANSPGNLPHSDAYVGNDGRNLAYDAGPPLEMISAVYSGILAEGIQPLQAFCPTGNCTFPITPSMAVCGACVNSTFTASAGCIVDIPSSESSEYYPGQLDSDTCNYTFPSGSTTNIWNFNSETAPDHDDSVTTFTVTSGTGGYFNRLLNERLYIMNVDFFGTPFEHNPWTSDATEGILDSLPDAPLTHTECALWMCVQAYTTTVNSSIQYDQPPLTFDQSNNSTFYLATEPATYSSETVYDVPTYWQFETLPGDIDPQGQANLTVNSDAFFALQSYMDQTMNGSASVGFDNQEFSWSNDLTYGIWNGTTDPDTWIANLALSMTNVVRSSSPSVQDEYTGTPYELAVKIQWLWIIYPATLVVLSIIFLLAVLIRTACNPVVGSWKGSLLTMLLFDVDAKVRSIAQGHTGRTEDLGSDIGETRVRFVTGDGPLGTFYAIDE